MRWTRSAGRSRPLALLAALGLAALALAVRDAVGSDHQDTPEVELSPRMDVNDVYAFSGATDDRIVLVLTTSSPLTPAQSVGASFDPNLLYQLKIDNDGDAVEDLVLQFTFEGTGASQRVVLRGPVIPVQTGVMNRVSPESPTLTGPIGQTLGSPSDIQLFAGLRDDPFFLDLEQFFRIIPDRKPVTGPLSQLPDAPTATAFRNPAPDYLAGVNALAIVVELPESGLTAGGTSRIGVWGTISR